MIGLKLMETRVTGALTDLEGSVVKNGEINISSKDPDEVITAICDLVSKLRSEEKIPVEKLFGIGIGLAGIIQHEEGIVQYSPYFGWEKLNLVERINACLHVPVFIDNDVNTLTIAENLFGSGQGEKDFLTVTIGRGIGLGMMINGSIYRGSTGGAGEWGHIVLDPAGPLCSCGKRGCFEAYVSEPALVGKGKSILGDQVSDLDDLIHLADQGNQDAKNIFKLAGQRIGIQIANLVNLLSPGLIVVGGEGTRTGDHLFDPMQKAICENVMQPLAESYKIRIEPWGDDAWARGAACLVLDQIFNPLMVQ